MARVSKIDDVSVRCHNPTDIRHTHTAHTESGSTLTNESTAMGIHASKWILSRGSKLADIDAVIRLRGLVESI